MTNDSAELIFAIVATIIGGLALAISTIALALIVGIKNSTHQVVWKPLEEPKQDDPFAFEPEEEENLLNNPNKRFKNDLPKEEPEFADLSDPTVSSGF